MVVALLEAGPNGYLSAGAILLLARYGNWLLLLRAFPCTPKPTLATAVFALYKICTRAVAVSAPIYLLDNVQANYFTHRAASIGW